MAPLRREPNGGAALQALLERAHIALDVRVHVREQFAEIRLVEPFDGHVCAARTAEQCRRENIMQPLVGRVYAERGKHGPLEDLRQRQIAVTTDYRAGEAGQRTLTDVVFNRYHANKREKPRTVSRAQEWLQQWKRPR